MNGIGQGWQAAVVVADKAVAFAAGRTAGSPGHVLAPAGHGGLSALGVALLTAIVAGAIAAVVLGGGLLRGTTATRRAPGARATGDGRPSIGRAPGIDGRPAAVRARRASRDDEHGRPRRDERR